MEPLRGTSKTFSTPRHGAPAPYNANHSSERIEAARTPKVGGRLVSEPLVDRSSQDGAVPRFQKNVFNPATLGPQPQRRESEFRVNRGRARP